MTHEYDCPARNTDLIGRTSSENEQERAVAGMTRADARELYEKVFKVFGYTSEWDAIHKEMQLVVSAETDAAAVDVILWWGCWKDTSKAVVRRDCLKAVKRLRKVWAKMQERKP